MDIRLVYFVFGTPCKIVIFSLHTFGPRVNFSTTKFAFSLRAVCNSDKKRLSQKNIANPETMACVQMLATTHQNRFIFISLLFLLLKMSASSACCVGFHPYLHGRGTETRTRARVSLLINIELNTFRAGFECRQIRINM